MIKGCLGDDDDVWTLHIPRPFDFPFVPVPLLNCLVSVLWGVPFTAWFTGVKFVSGFSNVKSPGRCSSLSGFLLPQTSETSPRWRPSLFRCLLPTTTPSLPSSSLTFVTCHFLFVLYGLGVVGGRDRTRWSVLSRIWFFSRVLYGSLSLCSLALVCRRLLRGTVLWYFVSL